ncbi:hypothetical protein KUTeg_001910 [Tegillarca granosa]|uniref:Uncharacterized protein n=1 Tax=Tegillarca granosa TaxID=220873 RepID=A0ABQ9FX79_TEGGR|nr:hypothetical protein KUTeg_001910 [Tegillarca granosa]
MADSKETLAELLETSFLNCSHCSNKYQECRLLPCLHTFCEQCIKGIQETGCHGDDTSPAKEEKDRELTKLSCPICMSMVEVPQNGIADFSENSFLNNLCELHDYKKDKNRPCEYCKYDGKDTNAMSLCLECKDDMCQNCADAHRRTKITRDHKVIPFSQIQNGRYDHDIREYQHKYCISHPNHELSLFCEKCESLICSECKLHDHNDHRWSKFDDAVSKYKVQIEGLLSGINGRIPSIQNYVQFLNQYCTSMEENKAKMCSDIENQTNMLHNMIDQQKNQVIENITELYTEEENQVKMKVQNLETASKSLQDNIRYLDNLLVHGKSEEILQLHRDITFRLTQLIHLQLDGISTKLKVNFLPGMSTDQNIQTVFGKLSVNKVPITQKENAATLKSGLSISTILPNVRNSATLIQSFDGEGKNEGKDVWPTGLAITKNDEMVLVDRGNKKVKIYDGSGKLKTEIYGPKDNKLQSPFDVTILKSGNLAVTDHGAEDVKIFKPNGEFVSNIKGQFKYPRGITTNSKGEIIVVDCNLLQLTVHDPESGKVLKTISGKDNSGLKLLVDPYYVSVTHQDNILVTDTAAPNIKVFSPDGKYLADYGNYGTKEDQILQPYGICCDDYGHMLVADNKNHRIHLLLPDGKFSKFLLTKNDGLWHPMSVCITRQGYFTVAEALGKVKMYQYI